MKKVAIFSDGWRKFFNFSWVDGCHQYILDHHLDAQVYVFNSFGDFSVDEKFKQEFPSQNYNNVPIRFLKRHMPEALW